MKEEDDQARLKTTKEHIQKGYGCYVYGYIAIQQINGSVHVSFHQHMNVFFALRNEAHDLFIQLNLSYEIVDLHFGHIEEAYKTEEMKIILKKMDLAETLFENYVDHESHKYGNFIGGFWLEVMPYTFKDHTTGFEYKSMQHSFNRRIKVWLLANIASGN